MNKKNHVTAITNVLARIAGNKVMISVFCVFISSLNIYIYIHCFTYKEHAFMIIYVNISRIISSIKFIIRYRTFDIA